MSGGFELAEIWGGAGATWRALGMREGGCGRLDVMAFAVAPIGRGVGAIRSNRERMAW